MTYYELLGVDNDSSIDDIKLSYRKLCKKYHPDVNNGDSTIYIKIKEAYEVLSNDKKRMEYDLSINKFKVNKDIYEVNISVMESLIGCNKKVTIPLTETCDCGCLGLKCIFCEGTGFTEDKKVCPRCHGYKYENPKRCSKCHGSNKVQKNYVKNLSINVGISNGEFLKVIVGNQLVKVRVNISRIESDRYDRKGNNLIYKTKIDPITSVIGGKIIIPLLNGSTELIIRENSKMESMYRIPDEGVPNTDGSMIVIVNVDNLLTNTDCIKYVRTAMELFKKHNSKNIKEGKE